MDRLLFAGLQILSVLSFTAHASSSRPHIIFILADDLVSIKNRINKSLYSSVEVFTTAVLLVDTEISKQILLEI